MHSKHMDFRRELSNSLHEIINGLEGSDQLLHTHDTDAMLDQQSEPRGLI